MPSGTPETPADSPNALSSRPAPLDPDYYLNNFHLIRQTVLTSDAHLFSAEELTTLERFCALPLPQQRLYVRLFNRTGPLFRLDRLNYGEIEDLFQTSRALCAAGFCALFTPESLQAEQPLPLPVETALACYTVPDLQAIAQKTALPRIPKSAGRVQLVQTLLTLPPHELLAQLLQFGPLIQCLQTSLFELLQHVFFLNGMQDATTLVTHDLALIRYPTYRIWRTRPVFAHRQELDDWLAAQALQNRWYDAVMQQAHALARPLGEAAVEAFLALPPGPGDFLERFTARSVHARTALQFAQQSERTLGREESARLYTRLLDAGLPARMRGEAWNRLALHWERTGWLEGAVAVCRQALEEPSTRRGERLELEKRLQRLTSRLARLQPSKDGETSADKPKRRRAQATGAMASAVVTAVEAAVEAAAGAAVEAAVETSTAASASTEAAPVAPRSEGTDFPRSDAPPLTLREVVVQRPLLASGLYKRIQFAGKEGQALTVEAVALEAYRAAGAVGLHSENGLFNTLCTLLFWDIFFAEIPDVFLTPFQDAPLDLNTDHFYETRRESIQCRLTQLRHQDFSLLEIHHRTYFGQAARGMAWDLFPLPVLQHICERLGGVRLAAILEHLLEDHRHRRRGFPDLVLWLEPTLPSDFEAQALFWGPDGYVPPDQIWFAEVKSPRDRVSAEQSAWFDVLLSLGIAVELCRVEEVP